MSVILVRVNRDTYYVYYVIWSANVRINTKCTTLIMKSGPEVVANVLNKYGYIKYYARFDLLYLKLPVFVRQF